MSRRRGRVELPEYAGMVRRLLRAYGARFATEGDEPELVEMLEMRDRLNEAIVVATDHMLSRGSQSWTTIGRALGISRQAARQAGIRRAKRLRDAEDAAKLEP